MADRLKYYDPVLERAIDDRQENDDGALNDSSQTFEEQKWLQNLRILTQRKFDVAAPTTYDNGGEPHLAQNQIDQQFVEINRKFNELNEQYAGFYNPDTMQQQIPAQPQQTVVGAEVYPQTNVYEPQQQQQQQQSPLPPLPPQQQQQQHYASESVDAYAAHASQPYMQTDQQPSEQQQPNSFYDPTQHQIQSPAENFGAVADASDYWAHQQQQQQQTQPLPTQYLNEECDVKKTIENPYCQDPANLSLTPALTSNAIKALHKHVIATKSQTTNGDEETTISRKNHNNNEQNGIKSKSQQTITPTANNNNNKQKLPHATTTTPFLTNDVSNISAQQKQQCKIRNASATALTPCSHTPNCKKPLATTTTAKRVNFDLSKVEEFSCNALTMLPKGHAAAGGMQQPRLQQPQERKHFQPRKNIIFNGTFPIDMPLQSRFQAKDDYDPEANASVAELKYACSLNDYDLADDEEYEFDEEDEDDEEEEEEDEEEDVDDGDGDGEAKSQDFLQQLGILKRSEKQEEAAASQRHGIWSMEELIANPSIPLNYQKMCNEVEHSLSNFEKYLDSRAQFKIKKSSLPPRTYAIDGPIIYETHKKQL